LLSVCVNAQEENKIALENQWFVEGGFGFGTSNEGNYRYYSLSPSVGKFVRSDLAIGIGLAYGAYLDTYKEFDDKKYFISVNPFVQKYWRISNQFYLFLDFSAVYGYGKTTHTYHELNDKAISDYSGYSLGLSPGFEYYFTPNWSINSRLGGFSWTASRDQLGEVQHSFDLGFSSGRNYALSANNGIMISLKYTFD